MEMYWRAVRCCVICYVKMARRALPLLNVVVERHGAGSRICTLQLAAVAAIAKTSPPQPSVEKAAAGVYRRVEWFRCYGFSDMV